MITMSADQTEHDFLTLFFMFARRERRLSSTDTFVKIKGIGALRLHLKSERYLQKKYSKDPENFGKSSLFPK